MKYKYVDYSTIIIDGIKMYDAPDFVDAYVVEALYTDGTALNEYELDELTDTLHNNGDMLELINDKLY